MSAILHAAAIAMDDEDRQIAEALRGGDAGTIDLVVDRYAHRLLRYLTQFTRDRALAEDLFQDTWLRVIERGRQYDPRHPFVAWLLTIARHLFIDFVRRTRQVSLEALEEPDRGAPTADVRASGPSPLDAAVAREERARVAGAIAGLPVPYREVLFLRFQEEMSLKDIARVTGVGVPTVKSRLHRGLRHLADRLGGQDERDA